MRIEDEIVRARSQLAKAVVAGKDTTAEEAYLRGLLQGQASFSTAVNPPCAHLVHRADGLDAFGHQVWRCRDCGEVTNV